MIKLAREIEKQHVKIAKIKCCIKFLLYCKKNNLAPIFTIKYHIKYQRQKYEIRI